jgi:hypothetical protein
MPLNSLSTAKRAAGSLHDKVTGAKTLFLPENMAIHRACTATAEGAIGESRSVRVKAGVAAARQTT